MAAPRNVRELAFRAIVEDALLQVPPGRVTTYGDLARAFGEVRAARAIGELLATNPSPSTVPCHRVVMADGTLGGYAFGGPRAKARRLMEEGVHVRAGRVEDMDARAVRTFSAPPVFGELAREQAGLARRVRVDRRATPPATAIGVDASYAKGDGRAFAAACAVDLETGALVAQAVATFVPPLPYVPGYLAFRELPGLVAAVRRLPQSVRRRSVLLVDGQGILHPRRCGIASMAGLELHLPSVGVAKAKLVGRVAGRGRRFGKFVGRPVFMDGEERGVELSPAAARAAGPTLYVSPGTGLTRLQAAALTARLTQVGSKGPDPVVLADRLSREARARGDASYPAGPQRLKPSLSSK